MPTMQERANAIATMLFKELVFPVELSISVKNRMVSRLYDNPPSRQNLSFQQSETPNTDFLTTPKIKLGPSLGDAAELEDIKELFCVFHQGFVPVSATDIDHVVAYFNIKTNQQTFFKHLNENPDLAEELLKIDGIQNLFQRDKSDGVIKGTGYFYKACYNSIENL